MYKELVPANNISSGLAEKMISGDPFRPNECEVMLIKKKKAGKIIGLSRDLRCRPGL